MALKMSSPIEEVGCAQEAGVGTKASQCQRGPKSGRKPRKSRLEARHETCREADATPDHNDLGIQQGLQARESQGEMFHGRVHDALGPGLACGHGGENRFGVGILASRAGRGRYSEAGCQIFQTVMTINGSWHWDLAHVPSKTTGSAQELPTHNRPSADSAGDGQEEKIASLAGTEAILSPGGGLSIIQSQDGLTELFRQA